MQLRAVNKLAPADRVEVSDDIRLFRVVSINGEVKSAGGRRKVHLRSIDGVTRVMLVRGGDEMVRVMVDD
jgi:hypothetical protein